MPDGADPVLTPAETIPTGATPAAPVASAALSGPTWKELQEFINKQTDRDQDLIDKWFKLAASIIAAAVAVAEPSSQPIHLALWTPGYLERMLLIAEEFVCLGSSSNRVHYLRAAMKKLPTVSGLGAASRLRFWVAQNETVPVSMLQLLAADADSNVRLTVAAKNKLIPELFELLSGSTIRVCANGLPL
jgi:hypothetical protein